MLSEKELLIELGNQLLWHYCQNNKQHIASLTRNGYETLKEAIAEKLSVRNDSVISKETFRRTFRTNKYTDATREKLAFFYYAITDKEIRPNATVIFYNMANNRGEQLLNYWSRFAQETNGTLNKPKNKEAVAELEKVKKEMQQTTGLLKSALQASIRKDQQIQKQFELIHRQRLADETRIRQLEDEVKQVIGRKIIDDGILKQAEKYFEQRNYIAYQHALDQGLQNNLQQMAETLYLKAKGYEATRQYKDALESYQAAHSFQPKHPLYIYGLGHFLYFMANYQAAIEVLNTALPLLQNNPEYNKYHGSILTTIGSSYSSISQYDKAITYFNKSLQLDKKYYGPVNKFVGRIHNSLGVAYMNKAENDEAIKNFRQALAIFEKMHGPDHVEVAHILNHWGLALRNKGEIDKALSLFERVIKIDRKFLGNVHPSIANCLNNMGEALREKGKYDDAIKCYNEATEIYTQLFPEGHPLIGSFMNNMGLAWKGKGDYKKCIALNEDALQISQKTYGKYHLSIGNHYSNLGLTYFETGNNEKANANFKNALEVYQEIYKKDHPDIARTYANWSLVLIKAGKFKEADSMLLHAHKIYTQFYPPSNIAFAFWNVNVGKLRTSQGNYQEAEHHYKKAMVLFEKKHGKATVFSAQVMQCSGALHKAKAERSKAIENYENALRIYLEKLDKKHPLAIQCSKELQDLKKHKD